MDPSPGDTHRDPRYPLTGRFLLGRGRCRLTEDEQAALEAGARGTQRFEGRRDIVRPGERVERSMLLVEGFIARFMDGRDGQRQLVAFHIPGDFVDLHGFPMGRLDHGISTLGSATVALYPHDVLQHMTEADARLTRTLWFSTLLDAAMHREWIFRLGRLGAEGRIAHFLSEMHARMEMVGLAQDGRFALPITQADLADATGVTNVHANRVLRVLRERGLTTFRDGVVTVTDRAALERLGEFEAEYLYRDETIA